MVNWQLAIGNGQWAMGGSYAGLGCGRWRSGRALGVFPAILAMILLLSCSTPGLQGLGGPAAGPAPSSAEAASPTPAPPPEGTITPGQFYSLVLESDIHYYVYLPAGYEASQERYPVLYLLHGRGENMADWAKVKKDLDWSIWPAS